MNVAMPSNIGGEPWRKRLQIPGYQIGGGEICANFGADRSRLAQNDQKVHEKSNRERLSYLQLIELAVVAAFRKAKFSLNEIRVAREYVKHNLKGTLFRRI
jgi:hypothetical protein